MLRGRARSRDRLILIILVIVGAVSAAALLALVAGGLWLMSERVKEANRRAAAVDRATVAQEGEDWTLNDQAVTSADKNSIREQVERCWNVPAEAHDADNLAVDIRVRFNADGSLKKPPQIVNADRLSDPAYRAAAESALKSVVRCAPYRLPDEKFAQIDVVLHFDPRDLFASAPRQPVPSDQPQPEESVAVAPLPLRRTTCALP